MTNNTASSMHQLLVLSLGLFCVPTLPALITSSNVSATTNSITITLDKSTVNLDMTSKNANGTFAKSNGNQVSVTTTSGAGYTLGIKADGDNPTKLINSNDSNTETNSLTSISSATTEEQFKSLSPSSIEDYNGKWGYLPSKLNSNPNTDFLPAPTTTGDIIDETSTSNSTVDCTNGTNCYTISLGARVDSTQKLGSYSNTYVIYASANGISYSIVYDDNVVANMPTDVNSGQAPGGDLNISDKVPVRSGYKFLGWCTQKPTNTNGTDTCGGTTYTSNQGVNISNATAFTLFAMWKELPPYIQDYTLAKCQSEASSSNATVYDRRDGSDYTVRYINGACWMTQNLRISGTISSADSNFSANGTWNVQVADLTAGETTTEARSHFPTSTDENGYTKEQLGGWYNYCAASAGTVCGDEMLDATEDICPAGWHLPVYNTSSPAGSFNSITSQKDVFSPIYGGFYKGGALYGATTYGRWWSANTSDVGIQYYLEYYDGSMETDEYYIDYGNYVRCVHTE